MESELVGVVCFGVIQNPVRHISITDGGHGDDSPPESVRNRLEVRLRRTSLSEINCAWKEDHAYRDAKKRKKNKKRKRNQELSYNNVS